MMANASHALDQLRYSRQGPQVGAEAMGVGAGPQGPVHLLELRRPEARFAPGSACPLEPRSPLRFPCVIPVVGGDSGNAQRLRHPSLRFATREQPRGLEPTRFQRGKIPWRSGHASA